MNKVLFLNHSKKACGVYQFGKRVFSKLSNSLAVNYIYEELDSKAEYENFLTVHTPDYIIYNWHRSTMSWLTEDRVRGNKSCKHYFIFHDDFIRQNYDKYLFFGGLPLNENSIPEEKRILLPRPLLKYTGDYKVNDIVTIGSFGFPFFVKGFHTLVDRINKTFDKAVINLLLPQSYFSDPTGKQKEAVIQACRNSNNNPNVKLNIYSDFLSDDKVLEFLAGNDINIFNYSDYGDGYSSATDYALSVKRPIAISDSTMFRHIRKDEILLSKNSIQDILARGTEPLEEFYEKWSRKDFNRILDKGFSGINFTVNRLFRDADRRKYQPIVEEMTKAAPEIMKRKIPRANVQQAFGVDMVRKHATKQSKILCVGSYDDTALELLLKDGYDIVYIDTDINCDLHTFFTKTDRTFDIIFSISVIEHVDNDEEFTEEICRLLNPKGVAILTFDFREDYKPGNKLPQSDKRFYTDYDIKVRLANVIERNNCEFAGELNYEGDLDFTNEGVSYNLAGMVFYRKE